jgi:MFS family permease
MAVFSAAPFIGPAIGPLVGGFLSDAKGWRWLYWIQLIMSGAAWILITFTLPETFAPAILSKRAKKLRKETGDSKYVTEQQLNPRPLRETLHLILFRPMQLLALEPIVFLVAVYMSVIYGLLYMFFVAFPIIYQEGKGYTAGITGLMFIPLALGVVISSAFSPLVNNHYLKMCAKHGPNPPPELRLYPMMISCWFVPIGLFIFACTYPVPQFRTITDENRDVLLACPLARSLNRWIPRRTGIHLRLQLSKQLHRYLSPLPLSQNPLTPPSRFIPTPSSIRPRSQDLLAFPLGSGSCSLHGPDVSSAGI